MQRVMISLPSTSTVQNFVETLAPLEGDFDLVSGRYILDAKSLMGIFTLNLESPIQLNISNDTEENMRAIAPFLAPASKGQATEAEK